MMIDEYDDISLIQIALSLNLIILLTLHAKGTTAAVIKSISNITFRIMINS
jgi:hypothetical protein